MRLSSKFFHRAQQKPGEVVHEGDTERDTFRGLPLVIENRKGTIREGTDPNGHHWSVTLGCDYGYIPDTEAAGDKEGLDVYIGPDPSAEYAYVVEQLKDDGEFDEYKVVLGAPDLQTAEELYLSNYEEGWESHIGEIYEISFDHLFDAVERHQAKTASSPVVDQAVELYERQKPLYAKAADLVRKELEEAIADRGVRAAVTCRAKSVDSLRGKLEKRNAQSPYASVKEIFNDIKDLAGVRVALYFPRDRKLVDEIVLEMFSQARPPKQFPEERDPGEPEGYEATHFAVKVAGLVVEIQVASALMYAWSEVAHDLIYKPRLGQLKPEEYQLLDDLKEIVSAGEHTVTSLQNSLNARTAGMKSARRHAVLRYWTVVLSARRKYLTTEKV
jgi:ppGpp synthetase/RelA/SpoT-type nucleotidyltranferase